MAGCCHQSSVGRTRTARHFETGDAVRAKEVAGMRRLALTLKQASDATDRVTRWALFPIAVTFILIVFGGVLTRFVFRTPMVSSEEFARITFLWTCFLGAAICVKRENHIRFEFLDSLLGKARPAFDLAITLVSIAFYLFLIVKGLELLLHVLPTMFPASGISQAWMYGVLPLSCLLMMVHFAYFILRDLSRLVGKPLDSGEAE
jgi:TRAP-type C4-dicarboxylate transport system permease small subunit